MMGEQNILCCPKCHGDLKRQPQGVECIQCRTSFPSRTGFLDFRIEDFLKDSPSVETISIETYESREKIKRYFYPYLNQKFPTPSNLITILSIGCGVGTDVETLVDLGYNCFGIDCGNRTKYWNLRKNPERYYLASGLYTPFKDNSFDVVFSIGVIEHIGTIGDTLLVDQNYKLLREKFAQECLRITKPGG